MKIEEKLEAHRKLSDKLKIVKEQEMKLRKEICNDLEIDKKTIGTHHQIIKGMKVSI